MAINGLCDFQELLRLITVMQRTTLPAVLPDHDPALEAFTWVLVVHGNIASKAMWYSVLVWRGVHIRSQQMPLSCSICSLVVSPFFAVVVRNVCLALSAGSTGEPLCDRMRTCMDSAARQVLAAAAQARTSCPAVIWLCRCGPHEAIFVNQAKCQ